MPIDMSAAKAPPKKRTPAAASNRQVAAVETLAEKRANGLMGLAQLAQGACLMVGNYADAAAVGQHAPRIAPELANLADNNVYFAAGIDFLIQAGPYAGLLTAVLPFGLQIAANHNWLDASRLYGQGVMPPAVLEAQMQAQVMQMQAEAVKTQQDALRAAQDAKEELERMMGENTERVPV